MESKTLLHPLSPNGSLTFFHVCGELSACLTPVCTGALGPWDVLTAHPAASLSAAECFFFDVFFQWKLVAIHEVPIWIKAGEGPQDGKAASLSFLLNLEFMLLKMIIALLPKVCHQKVFVQGFFSTPTWLNPLLGSFWVGWSFNRLGYDASAAPIFPCNYCL